VGGERGMELCVCKVCRSTASNGTLAAINTQSKSYIPWRPALLDVSRPGSIDCQSEIPSMILEYRRHDRPSLSSRWSWSLTEDEDNSSLLLLLASCINGGAYGEREREREREKRPFPSVVAAYHRARVGEGYWGFIVAYFQNPPNHLPSH
jgi:hypothetical protein